MLRAYSNSSALGHFLEWNETMSIFLFVTQHNTQISDQMCRHTERADSLKMDLI
jgi:hypothetical protein